MKNYTQEGICNSPWFVRTSIGILVTFSNVVDAHWAKL